MFDIICHVAYDMPPLTRKERANNVKKRNYFTQYGSPMQIINDFGGKPEYMTAVKALEDELYREAI